MKCFPKICIITAVKKNFWTQANVGHSFFIKGLFLEIKRQVTAIK